MDFKVIESLHATIRRRIRARGTQTRGVDFENLAAEFLLDRARQRHARRDNWRQFRDERFADDSDAASSSTAGYGSSSRSAGDLSCSDQASTLAASVNSTASETALSSCGSMPEMIESSDSEASDGSDAETDSRPVSQTGGGGGTWRAYVRHRTLGQKGLPDLHALAAEYRSCSVAMRNDICSAKASNNYVLCKSSHHTGMCSFV